MGVREHGVTVRNPPLFGDRQSVTAPDRAVEPFGRGVSGVVPRHAPSGRKGRRVRTGRRVPRHQPRRGI